MIIEIKILTFYKKKMKKKEVGCENKRSWYIFESEKMRYDWCYIDIIGYEEVRSKHWQDPIWQ